MTNEITQLTVGDLLREIQMMAEVEGEKLPLLQRYTWFAAPGAPPTVFSFGQPSPIGGDKGYRIWGMFRRIDEGEVSVYLLWGGGIVKEGQQTPPMRYILDCTVSNYGAEAMGFERWKDEYANELTMLARGTVPAEREREAILGYLQAAADEATDPNVMTVLSELIDEIGDGAHNDEGDDEASDEPPEGASDDEVTPPNGTTVTPSAVAESTSTGSQG